MTFIAIPFLFAVGDCAARMKLDPRTGCLVLPVNPAGNLQFYRPENDSVLMTVCLRMYNLI